MPGATLPVRRWRCDHFTTLAILAPNVAATQFRAVTKKTVIWKAVIFKYDAFLDVLEKPGDGAADGAAATEIFCPE